MKNKNEIGAATKLPGSPLSEEEKKVFKRLEDVWGNDEDGEYESLKPNEIILPEKRVHKTPRLLMSDAYTIGSNEFESVDAKEKSVYYVVFRRELHKTNRSLYTKGDNRMLFAGLQRITEELFREPITHEEIDLTKEYLSNFKVSTTGLKPYSFPEKIWRDVVDNFCGRPPIEIKAMPEGSVVYPGEPVIQITSKVRGMGILAAWFEEALLHVWAASESLTQSEHWLKNLKLRIKKIDPVLSEEESTFFASTMLHGFGARAAIHESETEILAMYNLISFPGTDSCSAGYQAWMNSNKTPGLSMSVKALAHRNVQAYENESDCYTAQYEAAEPGDIISQVADCYDYEYSVENYQLPLAIRSLKEGKGVIVVARPDSGNALEQVIWTLNLAVNAGLYTERTILGKTWKFGTYLKFIEGDGMTFEMMNTILDEMEKLGFAIHGWGLFGQGGGQRNFIKRDNFGAKYALCSKGLNNVGVVKLSETIGKTTLPGPFKVLRTKKALLEKKTIVNISEPGDDSMVLYYDGSNISKPFGIGQDDNFVTIKNRVKTQFPIMPLNLDTKHGAPASDFVLKNRISLIQKYAPNKDINNY